MARRPLAARFVYLSCLAAGIVVHTSATRFASTAAPHHHQEERHSFQPHEVGERCRAAKAFPLVKDVSRTDGGLLKNAVLHFASELPEGEQLTAERAPKLVDREYRREYSLDEFEIIVPPEEQDGGEKEPQPHEEALAEMAGKTLREELWVLLGALDRRLHLLEGWKWFDFRNVLWTHRHHWLGGSDSIGREMTGEEVDAGHMFPAQFAALRALLGEQIAVGYEDTAAARLRQLRGLAVGVEALSKRIDLQEQLQALEALPRVNVGSTTGTGASAIMMATLQLLTHKVGISRENGGWSSADHQDFVADLLGDVEQAEARVADLKAVELPVLVAALWETWRGLNSGMKLRRMQMELSQFSDYMPEGANRIEDRLKAILTELKEHIFPIATAPPVFTSQRLLSLAGLVSQLLKLEDLEQRLEDLHL
eukprot:g18752.t1